MVYVLYVKPVPLIRMDIRIKQPAFYVLYVKKASPSSQFEFDLSNIKEMRQLA